MKDAARFTLSLQNAKGRLRYTTLTEKKEDKPIKPVLPVTDYTIREIVQVKNGEIVATYPSIQKAAEAAGCTRQDIWRVLRGIRASAKGYQWRYV